MRNIHQYGLGSWSSIAEQLSHGAVCAIVGAVLLLPAAARAQEIQGKGQIGLRPEAVARMLEKVGGAAIGVESIESPLDCDLKGNLTFGNPVTSRLGDSRSCYDAPTGIWVDIWTFSGQAGQGVRVAFSSTPLVLVTIQSYSTGTILADSSGCGLVRSCSFDYTLPYSAQFVVGVGSYSTGSYTLTLTSLTAPPPSGQPNLTPYRVLRGGTCTPADVCSSDWSDRIVVSTVLGTHSDSTSISPADTLYVDLAVINSGSGSVQSRVWTELYVDGALRQSWYVDPPWDPNTYTFVQDYAIGSLSTGTHTIRIRADSTGAVSESNESDNEYSRTFAVGPATSSCTATATNLCLLTSRFRVEVNWRVPSQGTSGVGHPGSMTSDTGYFWFFSSSNVELVIKVLDGRGFNGKYWVFYGALSDVEYTITVTDTATGAVRTYTNPQGRLASVADTSAF